MDRKLCTISVIAGNREDVEERWLRLMVTCETDSYQRTYIDVLLKSIDGEKFATFH